VKILTAEYLLPVSSEPIREGAVAINGDLIEAVGSASDVRVRFPDAVVEDFGEAAILPGFVNCHSHLEITGLRGLLDNYEDDFSVWLQQITKARDKMTPAEIETAAVAGAIEAARAGVTCMGDIGRFGNGGLRALKRLGLRGVVYQETQFSPDNKTAADDFARLQDTYAALREQASDLVEAGLSPHSPYTVSPLLFEKMAELALAENVKLAIHAAESKAEQILLERGEGFFTGLYQKFGFDWKSPLCTSIEFLDRTGVLKARPLLAHCNTVSDKDIETIKATGSTIAHCPKSNAKFGHGFAPFEKFLDSDIDVGLGSDSVASNNACDILDECRLAIFAARNRSDSVRFVTAQEVLATATLGGAKAMRLDHKTGSLEPNKQADLTVVSLSGTAQQPIHDVLAALVFSSNARDVRMTMVAGKRVYTDGRVLTEDEKCIASQLKVIRQKFA